jgi:deoxyribose-phosphate aldolase
MDVSDIVKEVTKAVLDKVGSSGTGVSAAYDSGYSKCIDSAILRPDAGKGIVKKFCDEAREFHFAAVCVNPVNVAYAASLLKGSGVKTCSVVGFPLGASTSFIKAAETTEAVKNGAEEIEMVINIGALKDREYNAVFEDISAVVTAAHPAAIVKVILETSALTEEEKVAACTLAKKAGADFIKTSTGFGSFGASAADVRLLKQAAGDAIKIKASIGINDRFSCDEMLKAGASRVGTSNGPKILRGGLDSSPDDCEKCGRCSAKCPAGLVTLTRQAY